MALFCVARDSVIKVSKKVVQVVVFEAAFVSSGPHAIDRATHGSDGEWQSARWRFANEKHGVVVYQALDNVYAGAERSTYQWGVSVARRASLTRKRSVTWLRRVSEERVEERWENKKLQGRRDSDKRTQSIQRQEAPTQWMGERLM
jgi:hypothetical protein